jgi:hypothetical protein
VENLRTGFENILAATVNSGDLTLTTYRLQNFLLHMHRRSEQNMPHSLNVKVALIRTSGCPFQGNDKSGTFRFELAIQNPMDFVSQVMSEFSF